jgi:hypothetical protein
MICLVLFALCNISVSDASERDAREEFESVHADTIIFQRTNNRLYLPKNTCIVERPPILNKDNFVFLIDSCSTTKRHDLLKRTSSSN